MVPSIAQPGAGLLFSAFHQPEQQRYVLHLLNYPSELPTTPVHKRCIVIRRQVGRV